MGVPLWVAAPDWEAANDVDVSRALAAGLSLRRWPRPSATPLTWDQAHGAARPPGDEGLSREREEDLLRLLAGPGVA